MQGALELLRTVRNIEPRRSFRFDIADILENRYACKIEVAANGCWCRPCRQTGREEEKRTERCIQEHGQFDDRKGAPRHGVDETKEQTGACIEILKPDDCRSLAGETIHASSDTWCRLVSPKFSQPPFARAISSQLGRSHVLSARRGLRNVR